MSVGQTLKRTGGWGVAVLDDSPSQLGSRHAWVRKTGGMYRYGGGLHLGKSHEAVAAAVAGAGGAGGAGYGGGVGFGLCKIVVQPFA